MKKYLTLLLFFVVLAVQAQDRIHVRLHDWNTYWDFPYVTEDIDHFNFNAKQDSLIGFTTEGVRIPFLTANVDSVTFEDEPAVETKDHYKVFQMYITTNNGKDITSRTDYVPCYISLNACGSFSNYSAPASIRGRGNSSWLWYDKKAFRFKLDSKHKILGLGKAKNWVLLANYRDVTDLMNTFVFEAGAWLGMPYTNHTRYVELFVNGDYRGLYQLTEQVQQNSNRVDVSDEHGILLSLDRDDGPELAPGEGDNFWSSVYSMPTCVKYPKDEALTDEVKDSVKDELAQLEDAIKSKDSARIYTLLDVPSMIHYLQLQELVENVELVAPRSVYLFKDAGTKWTMGPLWDFDAGYDFDWSNMTKGHNYFSDYRELVLGSDPVRRNGYDHNIPAFFTDLFGCQAFVRDYKAEWNRIADSIVVKPWEECEKYLAELNKGALSRDLTRWPISGKQASEEVEKMHTWLLNRVAYLTTVINAYPNPDGSAVTPVNPDKPSNVVGTITTNVSMSWWGGFSQTNKVKVDKSEFLRLIGISDSQFQSSRLTIVPLDTDGEVGENHTNGTYGGWFDEDGDPGFYEDGHVYIEVFNDLFNWNCGLNQSTCYDESHTVTMQMQYNTGNGVKCVNVVVKFAIG